MACAKRCSARTTHARWATPLARMRAGVRVGVRALALGLALGGGWSGAAQAADAASSGGVAQAPAPASAPQASTPAACRAPLAWPGWNRFVHDFVSPEGRVVDVGSADDRTVSEGQAYALFFALVANDRARFDTILHWTETQLAQGDLATHLPAWLWGRDANGHYGVLDANAASDADLWIAYALFEAGALWHERSYTLRATLLARKVLDAESAQIPGLGLTLLPGPAGFHPQPDTWRLNPSYAPLQALRGIATRLPGDARWPRLIDSSVRVLIDTAPHGFSPDWTRFRSGQGFLPDDETHALSAYNAIRVYLWAGMLAPRDPLAARLTTRFAPFADFVAAHGAPPETVDTLTGAPGPNMGNAGFSAAAVPLLDALSRQAAADAQVARVAQLDAATPPGYYTSVLTLFGLGWRDARYRFAADGTLDVPWQAACAGGAH